MGCLNHVDGYIIHLFIFAKKGIIMDDRVGITLIRHGMTKENERSAYIGWMDSPLSENGRLKVESYSDLWENTPIDYVFSSDLTRCVDTANILFPHQPLQKVQN